METVGVYGMVFEHIIQINFPIEETTLEAGPAAIAT